jgi:hypothetical protein
MGRSSVPPYLAAQALARAAVGEIAPLLLPTSVPPPDTTRRCCL